MANITTNTLKIGDNNLVLRDADAQAKIATLEADTNTLKEDFYDSLVTDTASGSIASFPDGADNVPVKSLTVNIEPVQSGSGDPSPDNVRPISGHTQAVVTRTGKNVIGEIVDGEGYNANGEAETNAKRFRTNRIKCRGESNVVVSWTISDIGTQCIRCIWDEDGNLLNRTIPQATTVNSRRYYVTDLSSFSGASYIAFAWYADVNNPAQGNATNMMVEFSDSPTDYEPYQGQTVTIDLNDTIYGGTLDVTTGVLTVDMAMFTISDLLTSAMYNITGYQNNYTAENGIMSIRASEGNLIIVNSGLLKNSVGAVASSYFGTGASWNNLGSLNKIGWTNGIIICAKYDTFGFGSWDNGTDALTNTEKTAIASAIGGVQIVWKLTTPLTIQLSAQEVRTLLGMNNIFADTGDTEVEYRADTKLYIEKLTAPTEDDMIADHAISANTFFMVGNQLFRATTAIASGATITVGTNATRLSLSDALNTLS